MFGLSDKYTHEEGSKEKNLEIIFINFSPSISLRMSLHSTYFINSPFGLVYFNLIIFCRH